MKPSAPPGSGRREASAWLREFDEFASARLAGRRVPGAAVAIVEHGRVVYRRGFGWRDREARLPATAATVFGLASLSKSVTALTALVLAARGVLDLEGRVADLLPGFDYPGLALAADGRHDVRLWHMLSHTSGVPPLRALDYALKSNQAGDPADVFSERDYRGAPSVADYDELLAYLRRGERPAIAPPGEVASYSNEGVALVGAVIERVTGRPFPEVVREAVLEPLGMRTATYSTAAAKATGNVATLYTNGPGGAVLRSPVWNEASAYLGTGFLKASVDDLARYLAFLLAGDGAALGIDGALLAELTRPRAWSAPGAGYALGWSVRRDGELSVVRHGGSLKGVASSLGFVPELGLGIAVLTNLDEAPALRVWQAALNLALGEEPTRAPYDGWPHRLLRSVGRSSDEIERLAGVYASGEPWGRLELEPERVREGSRDVVYLRAFAGEDREAVGRVAMLRDGEFVLISEEEGRAAAWDGGRFHYDDQGRPVAVQHGLRWYDRQTLS